jgi:hypothetical protein
MGLPLAEPKRSGLQALSKQDEYCLIRPDQMSALGHSRRFRAVTSQSVLHLIADIRRLAAPVATGQMATLPTDYTSGIFSDPDRQTRAMRSKLHDMPAILAESDWPKWLGEEPAIEQELLMLKPRADNAQACADEVLRVWPVNKMVGNVRNTGRELVLPI